MPRATTTISATQSLKSALRLKLGWMSSIAPPKALAPMKTGSSPKRPVRASGKASAAKAIRCTILSLPSGAGGGASSGQSIATVRVSVAIIVRGMSRYLRIRRGVSGAADKGKRGLPLGVFAAKAKGAPNQRLGGSDKPQVLGPSFLGSHLISFL